MVATMAIARESRVRPTLLTVARWLRYHAVVWVDCPDQSWRRHGCQHRYQVSVGMSVGDSGALVFRPTGWALGGYLCRLAFEEELAVQNAAEAKLQTAWDQAFLHGEAEVAV